MTKEKISDIVKNTSDSRTYKRALKMLRERRGELSCSVCPYHRGENYNSGYIVKSWKAYRKKQWKVRD